MRVQRLRGFSQISRRNWTCFFCYVYILFFFESAASGAIYYVDFAGGADKNHGQTQVSPFKHCPGDTAAEDVAKAARLAPGDRVIFKGGVEYRGTVTAAWSGDESRPIVYDGNTDGRFGVGKAIIQGGEPVTGWKKVASAGEVEGNPHWQELYYTTIDAGHTFFTFSLFEGEHYLAAAQDPKPEEPFFYDRVGLYRNTKTATEATLTDARYFTSGDAGDYAEAYLALHVQPNVICVEPITAYDPAEHKVTFKAHGQKMYEGSAGQDYAVMNSLKVLSRPGEYYLDEKNARDGKVRLIVWPVKPGAAGPEKVTISTRAQGFVIPNTSHIVIDGFKICFHGGNVHSAGIWKPTGPASTGLVIRNNEVFRGWPVPMVNTSKAVDIQGAIALRNVRGCVIENNAIYENRRMGIMCVGAEETTCRGNFLQRNGSTGISFHTCKQSKIMYNVVWDNLGMHANGISAYLGCDEMLIEGNEVYNSNDCFTTDSSSNLVIRRNIFDAHGMEVPLAIWTSKVAVKNITIENNLLLRAGTGTGWKAGIYESTGVENCIIRNNIIDGISCTRAGIRGEMGHNLWTSKGRDFQKGKVGDLFESDLRKIFVDPEKGDYRLRAGSPAIDAGVDVGDKEDVVGTAVPQGKGVDIGAYEFVEGGPRERKDSASRLAPGIEHSPAPTVPSH